ncbi:hypothetical protein GPALN_006500 [Globodera pallida]|nr:hypothetical protein GPALN_006500 [Globodera pallida]
MSILFLQLIQSFLPRHENPQKTPWKIAISSDVLLETFCFIERAELGLKTATICARFDRIADERLDSCKYTFACGWMDFVPGDGAAAIVKRWPERWAERAWPIPDEPMPNTLSYFEHIRVTCFDRSVLNCLHRILSHLGPSTNIQIGFYNRSLQTTDFEQRVVELAQLHLMSQCGTIYIPHELNLVTFRLGISQWLHTPRADGRPKMLKCNVWRMSGALEYIWALILQFVNASDAVNFIVQLNFPTPFGTGRPLTTMLNQRTRERLAIRHSINNDGNSWGVRLLRFPAEANGEMVRRWTEWERHDEDKEWEWIYRSIDTRTKYPEHNQMPTVALNLVLSETRVYSGECLSATVLLDSADPDNAVQEFLAEISGVGQTGWVNIHTDKIYETEQAYLNIVVPLCQQPMELSPGRHKFGLRVTIPDSVPSSFESQFGSIRYSIKVQLIGNAEHCSAVEVFPFLVLAKSYFDDIPHAIIHFDYQDEIDFTVCTLPFGTVRLQISLPRTVFCIGEVIRAHLHVRNGTRKTLKDCRLQAIHFAADYVPFIPNIGLVLKTQFEARSRYEQASDRKVVENVMDSYPLGRDMEECVLRVPEQAVPTHQGSPDSIIVLSYVLRFNALPGIETEIPVVVTSLGYRQIVADPVRPERNGQAMKGGGRERGARRL